jgi:SecD/SecF fusion protein
MVGVLAGAYSSIAICSPLYYEFNRPGKMSKYEKQVQANIKNSNKKSKKDKDVLDGPLADNVEELADTKELESAEAADKVNAADTANDGAATEEAKPKAPAKKPQDKNQKRSKRYVKGNKK